MLYTSRSSWKDEHALQRAAKQAMAKAEKALRAAEVQARQDARAACQGAKDAPIAPKAPKVSKALILQRSVSIWQQLVWRIEPKSGGVAKVVKITRGEEW